MSESIFEIVFLGVFPGFLMIVISLLTQRFPSEYGTNTGINTPHTRKSKEHWDYAQKYGPKYFTSFGIKILLINTLIIIAVLYFRDFSIIAAVLEGLVDLGGIILAFVKVEAMLKNFDKGRSS